MILTWVDFMYNRVIRKVRQTQLHNPELDHHTVRVLKNLQKNNVRIQGGGGGKLKKTSILMERGV